MLLWTLIVCLHFLHYSATEVVMQHSTMSMQYARHGDTVNLTCGAKSYPILWFKEDQEEVLQDIKPSYFSTKNNLQSSYKYCSEIYNERVLYINNVERSDSGIYYCTEGTISYVFHFVGKLLVTDKTLMDPSLELLVQSQQESSGSHLIMLMCVVYNWSHGWSSVQWNLGGSISDGLTTSGIDGTIRSLMVIPKTSEYVDAKMMCFIKENSSGKILSTPATENPVECSVVLYVGIGIVAGLLLLHQMILLHRRQVLRRANAYKGADQRMRSTVENEMVIYADVKRA
ncbi:uncharacterized protein LOC121397188 [Xenopus laevis]|uniref:Uncharacterized protein LOC121397188 n=1 Tax=Xenopus laevis TaxID=8355 RepID=A0A8J1LK26_XENLA|nr:uncharacterized protein LOC121397188 [Xenopus laevis]